ncbi:hypothetical protein DBA29_09245 [Xenophilus aerolatus]|nr:hypothetical protein [Xenophilus aerolatus]
MMQRCASDTGMHQACGLPKASGQPVEFFAVRHLLRRSMRYTRLVVIGQLDPAGKVLAQGMKLVHVGLRLLRP